jgi:SRSO17 transposase
MQDKTIVNKIDDTPLEKDIQEVKLLLKMELVSNTEHEAMWDFLVEKYHYLGSARAMGPRVKYIIWYGNRPVSAIGFNQAVYKLGARDKYIDWSNEEKQKYLKHVLNNNRFLIMPWVKIKNLASHIMALAIQRVKLDWLKIYGSEPYILETFVDKKIYQGTCYKASNWRYIGETRGFKKVGKTYEYHGNHKLVYLYFIRRNYKNLIGCTGRPRRILKKWHKPLEMIYMQLQKNNWHSELLNEANAKGVVSKLANMLKTHMKRFESCFYRVEQEFNANVYVKGLLSHLERKSIEPISIEFNPDKRGVRNLQFFMKKAGWDDKEGLRIYQEGLDQKISEPNGMITIDESGNRKKGKNSVGVASQYCGSIGKVDNSQVGVYLGYSGEKGYALVSSRIFMPEKWFGEDYKTRRTECLVPKDLTFKTKPQIAIELLKEVESAGLFDAKWVGVDSLYGNNKEFLKAIPDKYWYFADVPCDAQVWSSKPDFEIPEYSGKGRRTTKEAATTKSIKVSNIAKDDNIPWKNVYLGEGSKGPIYSNVKCVRVFRDFGTVEAKYDIEECWLFIREREDGEIRYSISNAPADIDESELHKASVMRWPIEQCFNEMKDQLGMDHCEARSWPAWHRHMLLVFIAYEFLLDIRMLVTDKKKSNFVLKNGINVSCCISQQ